MHNLNAMRLKRAPRQPETISVTIYGGVFYKVWRVPDMSTLIPQHSHDYDHMTIIIAGAVRVWRDDELVGDFLAPSTVQIPKHCKHSFLTLTSGTIFGCVHREDTANAVYEEHIIELED